jgi:NADPH:quinone reductase
MSAGPNLATPLWWLRRPGGVGAVVGQIARIAGCRVVGIVGSAAKASYITGELGFNAAINRQAEDVGGALDHHCPDGVNVYFENVGGPISEAIYARLSHRARVVVCGGITEYNTAQVPMTASNLQHILFTEARVGGFNIFSYGSRSEDARRRLARWYKEGQVKYREDVVVGLENAPDAFHRLFAGDSFGKLLVKVSAE